MFDIQKSALMRIVFAAKFANKLDDAKKFLKIASTYAYDIQTLDEIGYLQNEVKDYLGSIETLKKCLTVAQFPQEKYAIRANMAKMLNHLNEPLESIKYSEMNLKENPNDFDTLMEISFSHYLHGDYAKSEKMMRDLIIREDLPDNIRGRVEYNLGSYDLEKGDFKKGLRGFIEVGHKINIWHHREIQGIPFWDGTPQPGKTLYIHGEGGIGDEIIGFRFCENIKQLQMIPVWITGNKDLVNVFSRHGVKTIMNANFVDKNNAFQCMAMYLPILLDLDKQDVIRESYLTASEAHLKKWSEILPKHKKLAIKWSGNPHYDQDLHRSLPLEFMKDLEFDGVKINLQLEPELQVPWAETVKIESIDDTLAILTLCENVVTSCTSVAHMAGALGLHGIVCPPIACYYVWLGDAKWYKNMIVIRQDKYKDWSNVFQKVNDIIKKL